MSDFGCGAVNQDKGVCDGTILCPTCRSAKRQSKLKSDLKAAREFLKEVSELLDDKGYPATAEEIRAFLGEEKKP